MSRVISVATTFLVALTTAACLDSADPQNDPAPGLPERIENGAIAVWTFQEGSGTTVRDVSGVGKALDLTIADPAAVEWLPGGGLRVVGDTVLTAVGGSEKITENCRNSNELSVEAWVETDRVNQNGRIIALGGPDGVNFAFNQNQSRLVAQVRSSESNNNGNPATVTELDVFGGVTRHLVMSAGGAGYSIFMDGEVLAGPGLEEEGEVGPTGTFENWEPGYNVTVANDAELNGDWQGTYHMLAVYCRSIAPSEIEHNFTIGF